MNKYHIIPAVLFLMIVFSFTSLTKTASAIPCSIQITDPRAQGLISTPDNPSNELSKFGNSGQCVVSNQAAFVPYRIPAYDALLSLYYTQSKATNKRIEIAATINSSSITNDPIVLHYTHPSTNVDTPLPPSGLQYDKTAVIFIDQGLDIRSNITTSDPTKGLVLIVQGNINISPDVTRIDAVLISTGNIYTAGASCTKSDSTTTNPQLVINGSLISFDPALAGKKIEFCRNLSANNQPAEIINQQPKYLVILRDILSDTLQKWSEIQ